LETLPGFCHPNAAAVLVAVAIGVPPVAAAFLSRFVFVALQI